MFNIALAIGATLSAFGVKEMVDVTRYNAIIRNSFKETE